MRPSEQLVTSDTIKSQLSWRLREPVLSADPMLTAPILPMLVRLSLPNMMAMLAMALVTIAETAYVGTLGTPSLAGLALAFPLVMLQQMLSGGAMGGGVSSAISRAFGAGDERRASALAFHALLIGCVLGLASTLAMLLLGEPIYRLLGGRDTALTQALTYSNIVFFGAIGIWLTNMLAAVIRAGGNMKVPSAVMMSASVAQVLLAGAFGFGWDVGGSAFPKLGMAGIALGQVIAYSGCALFLLWYLISGPARVPIIFSSATLRWDLLRDILKVGAVASISPVQSILSALIVTRLVSIFGTETLAGFGIGTRLEFLLIPLAFGVGVTCVSMVGMAIGAGNVDRARRVAWTGGLYAAALIGVIGLIVAIWPDLWSRLFTSDRDVMVSAGSYFTWAAPTYGVYGLGLCLFFASQGAGKVLWPVTAGTLRLLVIVVGGWWLALSQAPAWSVFALIGIALAANGLATALAVYMVPWAKSRRDKS
jgi:putative MATE family efflux protein